MLGLRRTAPLAPSVMATNIEQIFRDFVMNKIREIEDEGQHSGVSGEGRSNGGVPPSPAKTGPGQEVAAAMECHGDTEETMECAGKPRLEDAGASENAATAEAAPGKEGSETPRKKNKKHKRHKSKKKKKKRKEEKESSSESGVESGGDAQVRAKTQGQSSKERAGEGEEGAAAPDPTGNVPAAGQPMEEGDGKTKKHKRHMAKKKKKKKKKEEEKEKQEKKSPSRSRSESTSASASESDSELKPPSKLPPASSPVFALGKDRESASPIVPSQELQGRMSPVTSVQEVEPVKGNPIYAEVSGEDLTKSGETCLVATEGNEKVTSSVPLEVASKPNDDQGNFSTKQDLPDIIPKLESTHKEEPPAKADADMPADGKENQEAEHEMERKSCSASRSKSRSRSPSKLTSTVPLRTPLQKSRSRSRSQKRSLDKQGSRKARSLSRRRSRSTSKKRSSPRKKRSRSQSGRRRSRSPSLKRSGRKSRSLSTRRRRRSDSRSRTRNRRSRSRSRRRTRSRSIVRRRRSRSRSLSRRRRSRSRSKRSRSRRRTQRSRSARRGRRSRSRSRSRRRRSVSRSRRSRSRSVRRTRRTRSRSIVILRRSRSRSLLRRNRRSGSRSLRRRSRSIKRRRSKSRSLRRSRRSRSRSPARRKRSKTSSPRRSRRSKSRSPTRRRRSRSDSHKGGQKQSQSPKKNRHSKSWSPTRNKSKSRSVSRDVQSCEKSLPPPQEKDASKSGTPAREWCDADLLPAEAQEKSQSPERPGQDDGPSAEVGHQTLNVEGSTVKEETPADPCVDENGTDSTVLASVGAWRPVPFLADSVSLKADPVAEGVNSSPSAEEATVTELPEECKSPKTNPIEKCFTPEMPLTTQDLRSDSPSQATSEPRDPESTEHLASAPEDIEHLTGLRSGSISPQSQSPHESVCVEPEESDVASCEAVKLEPHVTSPDKQRRTRSRSAECDCSEIDRKSERSRSRSVSKEGQAPAEKVDSESRSPSISKKESLSNQGRLSASPGAKKHSTSRSPSRRKKSKSKSPARRKHSRSSSSSRRRRSQSKSASRRKKSKSKSPSRKRKSRSRSRRRKRKSKSPARRRRTRSKSTTKRKKSRSKSMSRSTKRKRSKSRSPVRKKRSKSRSPRRSKRSKSRSPARRKRSKSGEKSKRSKSRSPARKRRSRSRSANRARRSRSRRSRSLSRRRRGGFRSRSFDRRDRWRREPSHSPILILRKKRSASRTRRSTSKTPPRLTELDKDQLLEIAKANAAAMCAKAGMPIPESLRPKAILQLPLPTPVPSPLNLPLPLPMNLSMGMPMGMPNISMNAAMATMTAATMTAALTNMGALGSMPAMPALPSITNKPPPTAMPNTANIEEVKRKVTQKANSISIKELTEKCKMIAESKEEMAVAQPHVSDDEEEEKPFGGGALRENKGISFSLSNPSAKPAARTEAAFAKEFPVSSGSQHRRKENEGVYGEWVPVDKKTDKEKAATSSSAGAVAEEEGKESDSVFPDAPLQPVDITLAVSERAVAQKRLAENPFDVNAICMLSRAQEQVDAWAQSNSIPGLFTGSTGAQVLSSEELSSSGPQAWVKKDQFLKATPVSGGVGEFLMRKMGWRAGEGLGKYREGTVEPIVIDFKTDRKGLVAEGEKMQKSGSLVVMKDLLGKHPVSALMEICNKKKWAPPEFVMVHHSGPDHRKNFLFKVVVNGTDYQPQTASPNKKHAKAMAATVALQAMGEVSGDSLHSGPVFTAATSTG